MGALGAALAAKKHIKEEGYANGESSSFIGFEAVKKFEYTTSSVLISVITSLTVVEPTSIPTLISVSYTHLFTTYVLTQSTIPIIIITAPITA